MCYGSGEEGHIAKGSPKKKEAAKPNMSSRPKERALKMTLEAEKEEANVTTCTFLVNDFPANILFNSRTNYSFVSLKFARGLALPADKLDSVLVVELTSLKFAPVSNCVENIVINLNGKKFHEEFASENMFF